MLGTNKSCSLCCGALCACWAVPSTFSLQLCLNLHFLYTQSFKVNQKWQLGASKHHSWACTQPYVCTWSSRFSGRCWAISVHLWILHSSAFPFKLLFIVCLNCYPSSQGSCGIAVLTYKCCQQTVPEKGFQPWWGLSSQVNKGSLLVAVSKGAARQIKQ